MDTARLKDKVVVITGASRGIGKAVAEMLKGSGAKLVLGARSIDRLRESFKNDQALLLSLDVRDEASVENFVTRSIEHFGRVDTLINAAGVGSFANILESSTKDFDEMFAVNLRGTYLTCKYFGRYMKQQQDGQILNIVSIAGNTALAGGGGYSASKFGVLGLTKVLQHELRKDGIRITSILPGAVNSSFWDEMESKPDVSKMIPVEFVAEHILVLLSQSNKAVIDEVTIMPPDGIL